jgi:hypothetical protein
MHLVNRATSAFLATIVCVTSTALALDDSRTRTQLLKLDPQSRPEQTCDTEVMIRISQGSNGFNAERVIAYTFGEPVLGENSISAHGAAFRSHGAWYHLSYDCETGPKHLTAHSLHYEIGNKIPHSQWAKYDLYD